MSQLEHVLPAQNEVGESLSDEDRKKQPLAGDLFRIKTNIKGLLEPEFRAS